MVAKCVEHPEYQEEEEMTHHQDEVVLKEGVYQRIEVHLKTGVHPKIGAVAEAGSDQEIIQPQMLDFNQALYFHGNNLHFHTVHPMY